MVSMSMTKKDARKCSHCGHNGHNSRTCNSFKEVKLFGVRIDDNNNNNSNHHQGGDNKMKMKIGDEFIRRSKSLGNLESAATNDLYHGIDAGYFSDGPRKKGKPWTEEEHRSFLIGLDKLGKGDWRGISKNYVLSRTSTQVASHAQKYFNRISTSNEKRKRRPSVFDVHLNDPNSQISSKASTSLPSIPNNLPEVQKEASAPLEQLFETCKIKGQATKTTPSATCEKPPLSPMSTRRFVVPDFRHIPSMMGSLSRNVDGLKASTKVTPTVSWYPVFNFPNPYQYAHILNPEGATFAPYVARPSSTGILSRQPPQVQSQAAIHAPPVTNKDGLNISIGALGV